MKRAWIAVALLSSSWLLGLGYFDPARPFAWACTLAAAVLLLADTPLRLPGLRQRLAMLILLAPALWSIPLPYKGIVALIWFGVAASLAPASTLWLRRAANGALIASAILTLQALVLHVYQVETARAHELPTMCGQWMAALMRMLGTDAVLDSATLVVRDASTTLRVGATWELLLAPGTACFVTGGCLLLILLQWRRVRRRALFTHLLTLLLLCVAWIPLRSALLIAVTLQQQMRATPVTLPNVGETLVSTWVHIGLLILFSLITGVVLKSHASRRTSPRATRPTRPSPTRQWCATGACAAGVILLAFLHFWTPVGTRKDGRVMVVERHSTWEPTTQPYRTTSYGEAGSYNYAAAYEYCSQYYAMSRLLDGDAIDDTTLRQCDVLVIKTPTSRYAPREVAAVTRFVERGGSLLMIGDHTNVFNMGTYLNDISRPFGFTFRNDLLFQIGDPYRQRYEPSRFRHPMLQYMPPMDFAVSCSIDPGSHPGTMVIRNVGLYNLPPAYYESNYHPQAEYRPNMQYGSWCQLWATVRGTGRVAAFADSTLFSNFCVFQPGKAELLVGMLEWLNHRSPLDSPRARRAITIPLALLSIVLILWGIAQMRQLRGGWLLLLAASITAWTAGGWITAQAHRRAMPLPSKHASMTHVVIDRTVSSVPLFTGAFADDPAGNGYGMLEQWIPRLGNFISRRSGTDAFQGDGLVLICPTRLPSQQYRRELVAWVRNGGQLVVFDSPDLEDSTANSILNLFDLSSTPGTPKPPEDDAPVRILDGTANTPLSNSCVIAGGDPVAKWSDATVAAQIAFGQGMVTVIGFSSLFNDANMGYHWLAEPDDELLQRYEVLYALLRSGLQN